MTINKNLVPAGGPVLWKLAPADAPGTVIDPVESVRRYEGGITYLFDRHPDLDPAAFYRGQWSTDNGLTWQNRSLDPGLAPGSSLPEAVFAGSWLNSNAGGMRLTNILTVGNGEPRPVLWRLLRLNS